MSRQIAIVIIIDIEAALKDGKLNGNFYMFDNLRTIGSTGQGTEKLTTIANGYKWCDESQASSVVFNWIIGGIGSLPKTLPLNYKEMRREEQNKVIFDQIFKIQTANSVSDTEVFEQLRDMPLSVSEVQDNYGNSRDLRIGALTVTGKYYNNNTSEEPISYLDPIITDITGEAVDKEVLYVAKYQSPANMKLGWYWSAATDTSKVGTYSYTMHITLFKPIFEYGEIVQWEPVKMTCEGRIKVTSKSKINGFTNGAVFELPI